MKIHKAAEIIPPMTGEEYEALKSDIKKNGLIHPIMMFEGAILDGRNRERACRELGVTPDRAEFTGDDPIAYVLSMNVHRRHLNASQLAMIGAKIATLRQGQKKADAQFCASSQSEAAKDLDVSRRSIQQATKVLSNGIPELAHTVEEGKMAVSEAAEIATLDADTQKDILASPTKKQRKQKTDREQRRQIKDPRSKPRADRMASIKDLAGQGYKADQIAEKIGICEERVRQLARKGGITLPDAAIGKVHKLDVNRIVGETVMSAQSLMVGLELIESRIDGLDMSLVDEWIDSLCSSVTALNNLINKLKKRKKLYEQQNSGEVRQTA